MSEPIYDIVESGKLEELVANVNERIREGWSLVGGVSVIAAGDDFYLYAQALILPATT